MNSLRRPYASPSRPAGTRPSPKVSENDARNHWMPAAEAPNVSASAGAV